MYKVFLNERLLTISGQTNITLNKSSHFFEDRCSPDDVKKWFQLYMNSDQKEAILIHSSPSDFLEIFQSAFLVIQAAGGVVIKKNKILLIFRNGKWDLPKGKIDEGETAREAAIREVAEECGISGHEIVKRLPPTYHIYQSPYKKTRGEWIFKETFWFEMKYDGLEKGRPQKKEGITQVRWLANNRLDEVWNNTYENLKQIISLYRV